MSAMFTVTGATGSGYTPDAAIPVTLAGIVTPWPVAKKKITEPRAAGLAGELTEPSALNTRGNTEGCTAATGTFAVIPATTTEASVEPETS